MRGSDSLSTLCLTFMLAPAFIFVAVRYSRGLWQVFYRAQGGLSPRQEYIACHNLLDRIVIRAWELLPTLETNPSATWMSYTASSDGLLVMRDSPSAGLIPVIPWSGISGIGLEMRPLFDYIPATRSYWHAATRINTGYQFSIVIVLVAGATFTIVLPLRGDESAVNFASHLLAFARRNERRLNLMGFEKALTRAVDHLQAI